MRRLVVDASALVDLLVTSARAARVAAHLADADGVAAPDLVGPEVLSALARLERAGSLSPSAADMAVAVWRRTAVESVSCRPLEARVWELRARVRVSDAYYVACAQLLGAPLLTCDGRLTRAPLPGIDVLLVR